MSKVNDTKGNKLQAIIIAGNQLGKFIFDDTIPKMIDSTLDHLGQLLGSLSPDELHLFNRTVIDSLCSYLNFPSKKEEG